jgi:hypothetical protein
VFIIAMECGSNIYSGHLNLLPLNGGEHDTPSIVVCEQVRLELDNQTHVCRGGDEFAQLLQPAVFDFLDHPLSSFKIFEVAIDVKLRLKKDLTLLISGMGGLGTGA